jgi:hypothetical protein
MAPRAKWPVNYALIEMMNKVALPKSAAERVPNYVLASCWLQLCVSPMSFSLPPVLQSSNSESRGCQTHSEFQHYCLDCKASDLTVSVSCAVLTLTSFSVCFSPLLVCSACFAPDPCVLALYCG